MSNLPEVDSVLSQPNPTNIPGVLGFMAQLQAALPKTDGLACFNHLYLAVTQTVDAAVAAGQAPEPQFLTALDVNFAAMYFDALREYSQGALTRHAWRPLLEARKSPNIAPIQFALAGMNAHINRDLPLGIQLTWGASGPTDDLHAAFLAVNPLLASVEANLRDTYFRGLWAKRCFAHDEDVVAMWSVEAARNAAWANGQVIWTLQKSGHAALADVYVETLDGGTELAGSGMLLA